MKSPLWPTAAGEEIASPLSAMQHTPAGPQASMHHEIHQQLAVDGASDIMISTVSTMHNLLLLAWRDALLASAGNLRDSVMTRANSQHISKRSSEQPIDTICAWHVCDFLQPPCQTSSLSLHACCGRPGLEHGAGGWGSAGSACAGERPQPCHIARVRAGAHSTCCCHLTAGGGALDRPCHSMPGGQHDARLVACCMAIASSHQSRIFVALVCIAASAWQIACSGSLCTSKSPFHACIQCKH